MHCNSCQRRVDLLAKRNLNDSTDGLTQQILFDFTFYFTLKLGSELSVAKGQNYTLFGLWTETNKEKFYEEV